MEQEKGALILAGIGIAGGITPFVIGKMLPGTPAEKAAYDVGAMTGMVGGMLMGGMIAIAFAMLNS